MIFRCLYFFSFAACLKLTHLRKAKVNFQFSRLDGSTVRRNFVDCRVSHDVIREVEYVAKRRKLGGIDVARPGVSFEKQHAASQPFIRLILFVDVRNKRPAKSEMRVEFRGIAPRCAAVSNSQQKAVVRSFEALDRRFGRGKLFKNPRSANDRRRPRCPYTSFGFGLGQCSFL